MAINFTSHEVKVNLKDKTRLKAYIKEKFIREGQQVKNLQYVFCSDDYLLEINQQFLQHDTYTDIVTFELGTDPKVTEGEIYISIDRVKENALHLCGYKDKSKEQSAKMRAKENECLHEYLGVKL